MIELKSRKLVPEYVMKIEAYLLAGPNMSRTQMQAYHARLIFPFNSPPNFLYNVNASGNQDGSVTPMMVTRLDFYKITSPVDLSPDSL